MSISTPPAGIRELESPLPFDVVVGRIEGAIAAAGLAVFARIDHAQGAAQVGLAMPRTLVIVYGNPRGGTPIMLAEPRAALDLPLRVLARAVQGGTVVAFHPIEQELIATGVSADLAKTLAPAQRLLMQAIAP